jgi:ABC-type multidrug transport system fused ATPase/permease subunit
MKKYLLVFLFLSLVPVSANAQSILTEWLNIPADWTRPPNIIYYVFIPFLGTFAIIWGILTATRAPIFKNQRVNVIISLVFTIALFYSNILPAIILYLFTFGGFFGVVVFFFLFFVLTTLFATRKVGVSYIKTLKVYEKAARTRREEIKKIKDIDKKIDALKKERERLVDLREQYKFGIDKIKTMDRDDPEFGRIRKTKEQLLDEYANSLTKIERQIRQIDEDLEKLLKKKRK